MTKPDQRTWNSPRTVLADQKTLLHEKRMSSMGALIFAVICMLGPLSIIVSGESRNTGALLVIVLFGAAFGVYGVYTMGLRKVLTVIPERGLIEEQSGRFKLDEKSFHPLTKFDGVRTRRRERGASKGRRKIFYFYDVFLSGPNETLPLGVFSRENQALDAAIRLANILRLRLIDGISAGAGKPIKVPYEVIKKLQPDSHANDPWWKRAPVISLIAANLVPIGGVLLANWEIFPILLFYWLENLAIAVFSVASIAWAERASLYEKFSNSFVSLGMFAVFQSVLALVILVFFSRELLKFTPVELPGEIFDRYGIGLLIGIAALFASHAIAFVKDYVLALEYKHGDVREISIRPVLSAAMMQVAILTACGFLDAAESPQLGLVLLVLSKTTADVFTYLTRYREYSLKDYYGVVT